MHNPQTAHVQSSPTTEPIRFRTGKKRKAYRQRATAAEHDDAAAAAAAATFLASVLPGASSLNDVDPGRDADDAGAEAQSHREGSPEMEDADDDADDDVDYDDGSEQTAGGSAVAAAMRLRNARRAGRRQGVGFRSEGRPAGGGGGGDAENALILRDQHRDAAAAHDRIAGGITNRFMHQTGLLTILDDKHMNAYIESRLASRNADNPQDTSSQHPRPASPSANPRLAGGATAPGQPDKLRDQPTRHGKLFEVRMADIRDIAGSSQDHNRRRRVDNDANKPPPRNGRNRRNSEDIARDALVEQFLHENRLDVYDVSSGPPTRPNYHPPGANPSADDRLAEQFRRQFYYEQAMRRRRRRPAQQHKQQQKPSGDILRGPKLGGSRNMRATVRGILLQQEKEKRNK
ncbi:hypothetical protein Trco_005538 [Trichoderma cornu-damae]|uniref:Uncharacterized protein n=1 Tax=Trichoderma cornu-damae TaxID=654480 RepID=A0A9P8QJ61_9HYPO|nr:hypothetical protein Trco_005538 [Trichoderma cornu-damae]